MFLGDKLFSISLNVKTTSWSTTVYPPIAATDEALGEGELEIRNYEFKSHEVRNQIPKDGRSAHHFFLFLFCSRKFEERKSSRIENIETLSF